VVDLVGHTIISKCQFPCVFNIAMASWMCDMPRRREESGGVRWMGENFGGTDPFWTAPLTLRSTISPTLRKFVRIHVPSLIVSNRGVLFDTRTGRSSGRWRDGSYRAP
jgi:hypothetical protein